MFRLIRASLFLLGLSVLALAQYTSQRIAGFVRDPSDSPVPNIAVSAPSVATGQVRTAPANKRGYDVIANLPIGEYEVSVEARGFKKLVKTALIVAVNAATDADVRLEVGVVTESDTVSADSVQVESSSGEVGRLVTGTQIGKLQLNGRNYTQLLALTPGVSMIYSSPFSLFGAYGSVANGQSVNGSRTEDNGFSWNIDGADNKDNGGDGNNFVNLNPDVLAEFKVLTSNYNAEYGKNSGPVINLALKSGTRSFHGAAYAYVRNDAFDARAYNALSKPKLRFNNFGRNLGGPIYIPGKFNRDRSKFFFFIGQEFKRLGQGSINTWNIPPLPIRGGDLSSLPAAHRPIDTLTRAPFPNGIIPPSRISPKSKRLLDNYPAANFTGSSGNFVSPATTPLNSNQYISKGDYNINNRNQFTFHYVHDYYTTLKSNTSLVTYDRKIPGLNSSAKWTHVASPTTVNTFRLAFTGNVILQNNFQPNALFVPDYARKGQGVNSLMIYANASEVPSISVSRYTALNAKASNWNNYQRLFQFKHDVVTVIANHSLKAAFLS